jgi:hypothetical protein
MSAKGVKEIELIQFYVTSKHLPRFGRSWVPSPLIPNVYTATSVAVCVVLVELGVISWIRHRFMDTPLVPAVVQVVIGGLLVFLMGILIGNA